MTIDEFLEKWGRTMFEAPLASAGPSARTSRRKLAEIRLAVLDQVREKSYRSGGRKVFRYDLLRVELRGVEESRRGIFAGRFFRRYLEQELRNALRDAGCRFPENLRVDVEAIAGLPQPRRAVAGGGGGVAGARRRGRPAARLVVREGTANAPEMPAGKGRGPTSGARWTCTAPGAVPPQRPGVRRGHRDQPLRFARARAHPVRPATRRVPAVQRPLVSARPGAANAARGSCATA